MLAEKERIESGSTVVVINNHSSHRGALGTVNRWEESWGSYAVELNYLKDRNHNVVLFKPGELIKVKKSAVKR